MRDVSPMRRALMLEFCADHKDAPPFAFAFHQHPRCETLLRWLIAHRLVGAGFIMWAQFHYQGDAERVIEGVLARVDAPRDRVPR